MRAVRNIRLCTKDCLCLYVCPTGATDTEDGQIDKDKCIAGCRACVDACPSGAISLMPDEYPEQQEKTPEVTAALNAMLESKCEQERIAHGIAVQTEDEQEKRMAKALAMSCRIAAEDFVREAGFMLPQGGNVQDFLESLPGADMPEDFPEETVKELLELIK